MKWQCISFVLFHHRDVVALLRFMSTILFFATNYIEQFYFIAINFGMPDSTDWRRCYVLFYFFLAIQLNKSETQKHTCPSIQ